MRAVNRTFLPLLKPYAYFSLLLILITNTPYFHFDIYNYMS